MFEITYHPKIFDDLSKLNKPDLIRIRETIERKLLVKPELYGIRLRGELKEYWKLRIGNYRVVYRIKDKNIFVLIIAHRRNVYINVLKRHEK